MSHTPFLEKHSDVAAGIELLENWLAVQVTTSRLPGLSIGIIYDQELMWARGFGYADLAHQTPATPETLYRIASHTKMFTAVALLQLRDAGKLGLDDPITAYLPWFNIRYRDDQTGDKSPITIRHLLTHTSGLPRDTTIPIWTDNIFPTWQQLVETTPQRDAAFLPDTKWTYSNLGYALAGGIIEAVSGQSYADYIHQHLLQPLAMHDTVVQPQEGMAGLATGYMRPDAAGQHATAEYSEEHGFVAAGGITSSVVDMARFVMMQFRDESPSANPVLRGGTIREMHRIQWMMPDWKSGWGLGLSLWRIEDRVVAGHGGGLKGYLTQTAWCREEKFGVVALTNALNGSPVEFVEQAFKIVAPRVKKAVSEPTPQADPNWQQYVGQYHSAWGFETFVTIEDNTLKIVSLDFISEPSTILKPTGPHTFRITEGGNAGELVRFEFNDSGAVSRMYIAADYFERQ